jgi:hypothetical protein
VPKKLQWSNKKTKLKLDSFFFALVELLSTLKEAWKELKEPS